MTLTVNGLQANPGCVVDGHWGQFGGVHLLERATEFTSDWDGGNPDAFTRSLKELDEAWPRNHDGTMCGAYGSDADVDNDLPTGPFAAIITCGATDGQTAMELSEEVLNLLNENTEGGYWEWYDGECFLRSYICPECGRDATNLTRVHKPAGTYWTPPPCDYCCDADDPGCFA
jgi:hypothetical protein